MINFSEPFILTDKNRLKEIYQLRYNAFIGHPCSDHFDSKLISDVNGQVDKLDENGLHFIILNKNNNEIAATYRLNLLDNIEQLPYPGIFKSFVLPSQTPFLFYSRLVVDKKYRNNNLANILQAQLCLFHKENNISYGIGTVTLLITWLQKWGFEILGHVDNSLDNNYHYGESYAVIIHKNKIAIPDKI